MRIRRAQYRNKQEQLKSWVYHVLSLFEDMLVIITLGFYTTDISTDFLFSTMLERKE